MLGISEAGAALGSAGIGAISSAFGRSSANKAARSNRRFQKHMYQHRYQYQMEDMAKAGLNPILAYQQGAGGTPSGAQANISSNPGSDMSNTVANALKAYSRSVEVKKMNQEIKESEARERQYRTQGTYNNAMISWQAKENLMKEMLYKISVAEFPANLQQASFKGDSPNLNKWRAFWDLMGSNSAGSQLLQIPLRRIPMKGSK